MNTYRLHLSDRFVNCPVSWKNFIRSTVERIYGSEYEDGLTINQIQKELGQFRAVYTEGKIERDGYVDFPNERYYNLFLLKYAEVYIDG